MTQKLIQLLAKKEDLIVPTLFKPVQFNIIKKINNNKILTENEKRYLRGKIRKKLTVLKTLINTEQTKNELASFLDSIDSYYITGLEALKHNGYGWYYEPKIIEIINTKIEGKININGKILKLIRVKSIKSSKITLDQTTGLKYAANEQIIKDTSFTKNEYTKTLWMQMLSRYKNIFAKSKFIIPKEQKINYSKYGV